MPDRLAYDGADLVLRLQFQTRASRDAFVRALAGSLQVHITAPPVDGKANTHLVAWLAEQFGVSKSAVKIEADIPPETHPREFTETAAGRRVSLWPTDQPGSPFSPTPTCAAEAGLYWTKQPGR